MRLPRVRKTPPADVTVQHLLEKGVTIAMGTKTGR